MLILEKLGRNSTMNKKHIGFMLKLINDRMTNKFNRLLKEKKVTVKQLQVLEYLKAYDGKMITQKDLEIAFDVSHPTISRMLKEMEANHFINTYMNPDNRKMKIIEYDKAKYAESDNHRNAVEAKLTQGFTPEEKAQLMEYLERIYKNIDYLD